MKTYYDWPKSPLTASFRRIRPRQHVQSHARGVVRGCLRMIRRKSLPEAILIQSRYVLHE
jgi:hypothetical protein